MKNLKIILFIGVILYCLISCDSESDDAVAPGELKISESNFSFSSEGGDQGFDVVSSTAWSITSIPGWAEFSVASGGMGEVPVTLTVQPNTTAMERSDTVNVITTDSELSIFIQQEARPVWEVPPIVFAKPANDTGMRSITSTQLAREMGYGWNVGNSLDAIGGETAWGNPLITERLIDSVKAAGFTSMRVPVAWSKFSDPDTYTIRTDWLNRVSEVVGYILDRDMYAVMNMHWDGGWMDEPTYEKEYEINTRFYAMWTQIANHFEPYGDHLLFAGTNEVRMEGDYGAPTDEFLDVQTGFNQTFVNAVRSTGGRNVYRHLVVQGFNTNVDFMLQGGVVMPKDTTRNKLSMEFHFYDPWTFAINDDSPITQWGKDATDPARTENWGQEDWVVTQMTKMRDAYARRGYPVHLGEYGAIDKRSKDPSNVTYRRYYTSFVTQTAVEYGVVPFYWDNGITGTNGFAIFDRGTGARIEPEMIEMMTNPN